MSLEATILVDKFTGAIMATGTPRSPRELAREFAKKQGHPPWWRFWDRPVLRLVRRPGEMSRQQRWEQQVEFYEDLISNHGWKQERMLQLVHKLLAHPEVSQLWPSNSHEALGLAGCERYEDRLEQPMVYLRYRSDAGDFEVYWQGGQGNTVKETRAADPGQHELISQILEWIARPAS